MEVFGTNSVCSPALRCIVTDFQNNLNMFIAIFMLILK